LPEPCAPPETISTLPEAEPLAVSMAHFAASIVVEL
jgi:hypothetical protein